MGSEASAPASPRPAASALTRSSLRSVKGAVIGSVPVRSRTRSWRTSARMWRPIRLVAMPYSQGRALGRVGS
ncbi:hypothetical protein [Acrocarpospora pleiomorpha]|uniref:hypothetical protein n=1 Tax=Acrocarpospora pleiomorpha TaxID=90975 RepID=UPI0031DC18A4